MDKASIMDSSNANITQIMPSVIKTAEEKLWISFLEKRKILKASKLFEEIVASIDPAKISKVRCLGLGRVTESLLAMYQLSLLSLIAEYCTDKKGDGEVEVSLWDPIFTVEDEKFFWEKLRYRVSSNDNDEETVNDTLFYMPHFPIKALEEFITEKRPIYVLSNDLTVYSNKFTDLKYFELYPNSARIAKLIMQEAEKETQENNMKEKILQAGKVENDEFEIVTKKKRKRKNATKYTPQPVDYDFESAFFKNVFGKKITEGNNLKNPWDSAFTDLSFLHFST